MCTFYNGLYSQKYDDTKFIGVIIVIITILSFYKLVSRVNLILWTYRKTNANVLSWGKKIKIAIEDSGKLLMSLSPASFPTWLEMGRQIVIQNVPGSSHRSSPWGWFSLNETDKSNLYFGSKGNSDLNNIKFVLSLDINNYSLKLIVVFKWKGNSELM